MLSDLRYALRLLAKSPGFAALAVITIALGVGPNTTIFSMINAVLLRPLPYRNSERLVMLWETWKARGFNQLPVSGPTLLDWKREARSFEDLAPAFSIPEYGFNVTAGGEPERVQAAQGSANFFDVMGVQPLLGRGFLPDEDTPGGRPVAMLSYSFWLRRFGGDPNILGKPIGLDGVSHTVVGVLPPGVQALIKVDLWIPIARNLSAESRGNHNFGIMARLKPGVTPAQAQAEMDGIEFQLERLHPDTNAGIGVTVIPINELTAGPLRPALLVLLAAVGSLLLIACANVAGLLLARGSARQREIAVRTAVGASRLRIIRQALTESVLLAVMGGVLGVGLAYWCVDALRRFIPDLLPRLQEMDIDLRVLTITLAISVLTGILFGLAPAVRSAHTNLNETLKEGGRAIGGGSQRLRSVLLIAEIALSLVLLAGAGLLIRSFFRVTGVDPGFRADQVLTMNLTLPSSKYGDAQKRIALARSIIDRVQALPGVVSAAAISFLPLRGRFLDLRVSVSSFQVEGQPEAPKGLEQTADYRVITPGFFNVMGISVRSGRAFSDRDKRDSKPVVLINETLARRFFAGQDPIGRAIRIGPKGNPREIAGVVADVRINGLEKTIEPALYVPFEQNPPDIFSLVIRGAAAPESLTSSVRREILSVDSEQPVADVRTMKQVVDDSLVIRRLSTWMLAAFALLALVLASVGIYGLVSYSVTQRTHEIGLCVALGAQPADVMRMAVGHSLAISIVGVAIGLPAAFGLTRLLGGLLFGVTAADPLVFVAVPIVLVSITALAGYIPARRALRIDPTVALRYE